MRVKWIIQVRKLLLWDLMCCNQTNIVDEELATSEESGKDWSELEEEARKADKDHNEYDEPAQKKRAPLPSSKNRQPSRSFSSSKHRSPSKHGSSFKRKDDHHHHKSSSSSKKFKK